MIGIVCVLCQIDIYEKCVADPKKGFRNFMTMRNNLDYQICYAITPRFLASKIMDRLSRPYRVSHFDMHNFYLVHSISDPNFIEPIDSV